MVIYSLELLGYICVSRVLPHLSVREPLELCSTQFGLRYCHSMCEAGRSQCGMGGNGDEYSESWS